MSKGSKYQHRGWLQLVLSSLIILTLLVTGCQIEMPVRALPSEADAFVTDRVVEVRIVMAEEDWNSCLQNAKEENYVRADFWFDGELVSDVAVRPKGNSSLKFVTESGSPRLSLKVDFNLFNDYRTFRGLKKLNFNNGFRDPTLIRERLATELFEQMGMPSPRMSHVDLWVNDTHLGLYTQVEQVDKTFLRRHFEDEDGNLYKPLLPSAYLDWTEEDLLKQREKHAALNQGEYYVERDVNIGGGNLDEIASAFHGPGPTPIGGDIQLPAEGPRKYRYDFIDVMNLKTNETHPNHEALFRLLDVLNNEPDETFPEEIEKVLDVDTALRYVAVCAVAGILDSYSGLGHNYYLYEIDGRFTIIPWDMNEAFGVFNCGINYRGMINFYIDEPTCGPMSERPLIDRLLSHQPYLDSYHQHIRELLEGPFKISRMISRIDELVDQVYPFVESDEFKFFSTEEFKLNLVRDIGNSPGLKTYVIKRNSSVRRQLEGEQPSAGDGSGNGGRIKPFIRKW